MADVLVAWQPVRQELTAQQAVAEAQQARTELANQRYEAGVSDYLEVLDAERERLSAELSLYDARLAQAQLAITWFKVLGGGAEGLVALPDAPKLPRSKVAEKARGQTSSEG